MKIFNGMELRDLAIYTNKTLIVTDFHIGYEEALNKQGVFVPRFQFDDIIKRFDNIFLKLKGRKIERIIVNGDLKHEFGTISDQEWRHTLKLLDYFEQHCKEIVLVKGNHDTVLGPIAEERNVEVVEYYFISTMVNSTLKKISINNNPFKNIKMINKKQFKKININNKIGETLKINNKNKILVTHGNKIPNKDLLKDVSTIIIGHEHPAVSIQEGPRTELFKAYLIGKWKGKNLIVQPSFNLVTEGNDVMKEELLSPFLKQNLGNFDVIVVGDKLYRFGKLREL